MRTFLISAIVTLSFTIPFMSAQAHKYELRLRPNETLVVARNALKQGKFKKAINLYKRALKNGASGVGAVWAYNDLCVAYYLQTDLKEALGYCNQAIKLAPNQWVGHNNRGNVLYSGGFFEEAEKSYMKALKLSPNSKTVKTNLTMIQEKRIAPTPEVVPSPFKFKKNKQDFSGETLSKVVLD